MKGIWEKLHHDHKKVRFVDVWYKLNQCQQKHKKRERRNDNEKRRLCCIHRNLITIVVVKYLFPTNYPRDHKVPAFILFHDTSVGFLNLETLVLSSYHGGVEISRNRNCHFQADLIECTRCKNRKYTRGEEEIHNGKKTDKTRVVLDFI